MSQISTRSIPEQPVLAIRGVVSPDMFQSFIGGAFAELYEFVSRGGVDIEGPPMAVYHLVAPEAFDAEVCLPVAGNAMGAGRIEARTLPAVTVATTVHLGPYDTEGQTYAELERWIGANGYVPSGPARERYLIGPDVGVTPAEYRTEIDMPIEPAPAAVAS